MFQRQNRLQIELVSTAINMVLTGTTSPGDPDSAPLKPGVDKRNSYFL